MGVHFTTDTRYQALDNPVTTETTLIHHQAEAPYPSGRVADSGRHLRGSEVEVHSSGTLPWERCDAEHG